MNGTQSFILNPFTEEFVTLDATVLTAQHYIYITAAVDRAHIVPTQTIATPCGPALPLLSLRRKVQSLVGLTAQQARSNAAVMLLNARASAKTSSNLIYSSLAWTAAYSKKQTVARRGFSLGKPRRNQLLAG